MQQQHLQPMMAVLEIVAANLANTNSLATLDYHVWSALSAEYGSTGYGCQSSSWSAKQGNIFSLSPFAPGNLVSRDGFGHHAPRQPAHSPHSG